MPLSFFFVSPIDRPQLPMNNLLVHYSIHLKVHLLKVKKSHPAVARSHHPMKMVKVLVLPLKMTKMVDLGTMQIATWSQREGQQEELLVILIFIEKTAEITIPLGKIPVYPILKASMILQSLKHTKNQCTRKSHTDFIMLVVQVQRECQIMHQLMKVSTPHLIILQEDDFLHSLLRLLEYSILPVHLVHHHPRRS